MIEVEAGRYNKAIEPDDMFKYTGSDACQYILVAKSSEDRCDGCVFREDSGHPLSRRSCNGNGLNCYCRVFKPIDDVLESL